MTVYLDGTPGVGDEAAGDVLSGIEILQGSIYSDSLIGNSGDNTLDGGDSGDTYDLTAGGADQVTGTLADFNGDTINGFGADDVIVATGVTNIISQNVTGGNKTLVLSDGAATTVTVTLNGVTDPVRLNGERLTFSRRPAGPTTWSARAAMTPSTHWPAMTLFRAWAAMTSSPATPARTRCTVATARTRCRAAPTPTCCSAAMATTFCGATPAPTRSTAGPGPIF